MLVSLSVQVTAAQNNISLWSSAMASKLATDIGKAINAVLTLTMTFYGGSVHYYGRSVAGQEKGTHTSNSSNDPVKGQLLSF